MRNLECPAGSDFDSKWNVLPDQILNQRGVHLIRSFGDADLNVQLRRLRHLYLFGRVKLQVSIAWCGVKV